MMGKGMGTDGSGTAAKVLAVVGRRGCVEEQDAVGGEHPGGTGAVEHGRDVGVRACVGERVGSVGERVGSSMLSGRP